MTKPITIPILPCPFCGFEDNRVAASTDGSAWVKCGNDECGAAGPTAHPSEEFTAHGLMILAVRLWNEASPHVVKKKVAPRAQNDSVVGTAIEERLNKGHTALDICSDIAAQEG